MNEKQLKEITIGVFMGGISSEREISLKSGTAVFNALGQSGLNALALDIKSGAKEDIKRELEEKKIDFVFIALHGEFGEDGTLQKMLEDMRVPFTGSGSKASHLAMDKIEAKKIFKNVGLKVPEHFIISANSLSTDEKIEKLGFPLVVKPSSSGSSIGMSIVHKKNELARAISCAKQFDNFIIIEQFIKGRELTVGILEDKPLPPIEIITSEEFFNYEAKYKSNTTRYIVPAEIENELAIKIMQAGITAHKSLGCRNFSRADMILSEKDSQVYVLELNAIPGLTQRSLLPKAALCRGIDFGQLCLKIINCPEAVSAKL